MKRRDFLQAAALVGGTGAIRMRGLNSAHILAAPQIARPASPRLKPYVDPLPVPEVLKPKTGETLEIYLRTGSAKIHHDLPPAQIWGYNGTWPGPTIETATGQPISIAWKTQLPPKHLLPIDHTIHGAGKDVPDVRTVTHLHGARVMPEDDGYPEAWISPDGKTGNGYNPNPFFYPNEQEAGTLWYHDHTLGITRLNIYAGLAGFYIIRDEAEKALQLPSGKYEIPLMMQDRSVNVDGSLSYPAAVNGTHPVWVQQFFGDINCVNGKAWPFLEVEPRKYRLRILNASNSRFYQLLLEKSDSNGKPQNAPGPAVNMIGADTGLLAAPVAVNPLTIAPGERADIVIDFAGCMNQNFVFINGAAAPFSFGGESVPSEVLLFRVNQTLAGKDTSLLPSKLIPYSPIATPESMRERLLSISERVRESDQYTIIGLLGGKHWSDPITEDPKLGSTEVWSFVNSTEEAHPIHLHLVHFEVLNRQQLNAALYRKTGRIEFEGGVEPPAEWERGARKDTVIAYPEYITRVVAKFTLPSGHQKHPAKEYRYVWHCHILEHEDNEMMRPYKVLG
ncbi:MAG TPA: multicopper oxidase [Terriglobales bacterium]|nr:multicopper oxidase [Terriglobales bacterium]